MSRAVPALALAWLLNPATVLAQQMNAPGAACSDKVSTVDQSDCLDRSLKTTNAELADALAKVRSALRQGEQPGLQRAQTLWVAYRDAACAAERHLYGSGTAAGPAWLACLDAETRARIADIHLTYDWRVAK